MFQEDEEDTDNGKHRFLLCCILNNLYVLSNIMLPVCAHIHFAQYIVSCMKKKSLNCDKKKTLHRLLTANSSQTNYFYRGGG